MFCRNCGKAVAELAVMCVSCGLPPSAGKQYCQHCGAQTNPPAEVCIMCGVRLAVAGAPGETKSKLAAGLLGIFLGAFGIHKVLLGLHRHRRCTTYSRSSRASVTRPNRVRLLPPCGVTGSPHKASPDGLLLLTLVWLLVEWAFTR